MDVRCQVRCAGLRLISDTQPPPPPLRHTTSTTDQWDLRQLCACPQGRSCGQYIFWMQIPLGLAYSGNLERHQRLYASCASSRPYGDERGHGMDGMICGYSMYPTVPASPSSDKRISVALALILSHGREHDVKTKSRRPLPDRLMMGFPGDQKAGFLFQRT